MRVLQKLAVLAIFLSCFALTAPVLADHTAQTTVVENWNGQVNCVPRAIYSPSNLTDLQNIILDAKANNIECKATGASHSFSPIFQTNGYLIKTTNLNNVSLIDSVNHIVRAQAGITLNALDTYLDSIGLVIPTGTVIDDITIAGAVAPGCHGTGKNYGIVADFVVQIRIVDSNGILQTYSGLSLNVVKVNLGLLGIIYDIDLQLVPAFNVHVVAKTLNYTTSVTGPFLQSYFNAHASLEIYAFPYAPVIQFRTTDPTTNASTFNYTAYVAAGLAVVAEGQYLAPLLESDPALLYYVGSSGQQIFADMDEVWPAWAGVHYGYGIQGGPAFFNPEFVRGFNNNPSDWATNAALINALTNLNNQYFFSYGQAPNTYGLNIRFTKSTDAVLSPCNVNYQYCMWVDILLGVDAVGTANYMSDAYNLLTAAPYNAAPHWPKDWNQIPSSRNLAIAEFLSYRAWVGVDTTNIFVTDAMFRLFVNKFAPLL